MINRGGRQDNGSTDAHILIPETCQKRLLQLLGRWVFGDGQLSWVTWLGLKQHQELLRGHEGREQSERSLKTGQRLEWCDRFL